MKKRHIKYLILAVIIIAVAGISFFLVYTQTKIASMINNNEYYEAYQYITGSVINKGEVNKNPSVQFYDVMAKHYEADIIGEDGWILPDFTGWSCAEVEYALHNIGQPYEIEFVKDESYGVNEIIEQDPKAGIKIDINQSIHLYVNDLNSSERIIRYDMTGYKTIVEYGEWVYFAYENKIYKARIDGKESTLLLETEYKIESFIIEDNNVYYVGYDAEKNTHGLYLTDTGGDTSEFICEINFLRLIQNYGDIIFILLGPVEYNIETKEINRVDNLTCVYAVGKKYVLDLGNNVLYQEDKNEERKEILKPDGRMLFIYLHDEKIYYIYQDNKDKTDQSEASLAVYDMVTKETRVLKKLYTDTASYPIITNMNVWRDNLIITCLDASTIIYDLESETVIYTNNIFMDEEQCKPLYKATCGNYIYEGSYANNYFIYRYNMLTEKYEKFDIEDIIE